jgi:putative heme iron utilization protein
MSEKLMEFFNKQPRLGSLSTASRDGKVNAAYFNSIQMIDEKTVFIGLGNNRTFKNLQENPNAVFMILEPGKTLQEWKAVRVYLKMSECQTSGEKLENIRAQIAEMAGEGAAKMIHAAVTFEVQRVRPLADFGQGWEKSI